MDSWYHSDVTHACMEGLVKRGLLRGRTDVAEWLVPSHEVRQRPRRLRRLLHALPQTWTRNSSPPVLLGSATPLSGRAVALEPQ